jgi:hypothetical protein
LTENLLHGVSNDFMGQGVNSLVLVSQYCSLIANNVNTDIYDEHSFVIICITGNGYVNISLAVLLGGTKCCEKLQMDAYMSCW